MDAFILKIEAYIKGLLFRGVLSASLKAGFAQAFYGTMLVMLTIEAFRITVKLLLIILLFCIILNM